jgi:hypothetical protein
MAKKAAAEEKKTNLIVAFWLTEIAAAKKREKDYRKEGQDVLDIYGGKKVKETPYNILYSNTETLLPALYSAVPRPVVQRRFKDDDPLGKSAADAGRRVLEFLVDTNVEGYETFDEAVRAGTLDALLPGRGVTCVKYDADVATLPAKDGEAPKETPDEYKKSELVCLDSKAWNRVYFGYAKKWSKMPWIAYEEHIDKEESERLFGAEKTAKLTFAADETKDEDSEDGRGTDDRDKGERKTCRIYQIWDKDGGKKIRYVSEQFAEDFLKVVDDPLELTGFFNCPKPIQFLEKSNDLLPVAIYKLYENQAAELNELTRRIKRIVTAIKARGIYDGELGGDIEKLMEADDNALVPSEKGSSLAAEKGLSNAIWFMPVQELMQVLTELYQAREQCKKVIYEITGISDIIRGSSVASETATAQNLKSQWGTLRLKRLQKEVQRYARDLLRMMLEIAATKFSEETWAKMTGLPFVTSMQRQQLELIATAARQMGQPLDPQTQAKLSAPVWGQILSLLQDDMQRSYRIDIETNSTVEPEAAEDQKGITDLMTALAQYLNGVGPLVAKGVMPFGAAQSMLLAITRRFRFGPEVEDYIKQMQPPKPEDDGKAAEMAKLQAEQQAKAAELAHKDKVEEAKHLRESQAEQNRAAEKSAEIQANAAIEKAKADAETQRESMRLEAERRAKQMELAADRANAELKARMDQDTELKKAALQGATQIEIARINAEAKAAQATEEASVAASNVNTMDRIMEGQEKLLKAVMAPRVHERDPKTQRVVRSVPQAA